MGFGKREAEKEHKIGKFVGSTRKEMRDYARKGKASREDKKSGKSKTGTKGPKPARNSDDLFERLEKNLPVKIYRAEAFEHLVKALKENGQRAPQYREYLPPKERDAQFMFDMQCALARLTWNQLSTFIGRAVRVPVPMRDWSTSFHHALSLIVIAFGVEDYMEMTKKGAKPAVIRDREALDEWPLLALQRRPKGSKEEKMSDPQRFKNGKLKASGDDDAEEEDEDDEAETDEEEEEEEEKPKKKAKGKKAKVEEEEDEDEEESDEEEDGEEGEDEDEEEEEEEEEKPKAKAKAKRKSKVKVEEDDESDDEDEDEDDEEEEEDDEGSDTPKSKKKPVKSKEKVVAKAKKSKKVESEKPAKKTVAKLGDKSIVAKTSKKRSGGGPKGKLYDLVSKKGIKFKELSAKAEEELELKPKQIQKWITMMASNGFLSIE